jgi:hypothetical protein
MRPRNGLDALEKIHVYLKLTITVHSKLSTYTQYKIFPVLTHSMKQSPSLEANRFSAIQEIPRIL